MNQKLINFSVRAWMKLRATFPMPQLRALGYLIRRGFAWIMLIIEHLSFVPWYHKHPALLKQGFRLAKYAGLGFVAIGASGVVIPVKAEVINASTIMTLVSMHGARFAQTSPAGTLVRKPHDPTPTAPTPLRTFYVDPVGGLDSNAGTEGAPFQTVTKINTTAIAGDRFYIKGTTVQTVSLGLNANSGTLANPIQVMAWPGFTCTLSNGGGVNEYFTISGYSVGYWWLQDMTVSAPATAYNAYTWNSAPGWTFVNIHVTGNKTGGKAMNCPDHRWYDSRHTGENGNPNDNDGDLYYFGNNSDRILMVRHNFNTKSYHGTVGFGFWEGTYAGAESYDCRMVDCYMRNIAAGGVWASYGAGRNTIVEWCVFEDMGTTPWSTPTPASMESILVQGEDAVIRYNVIRGGNVRAILMTGYYYGGNAQKCLRNHVHNNTVTGAKGPGIYFHTGATTDANVMLANNVVENNILWGNNQGGLVEDLGYFEGEWYPLYFNIYHSGANVYPTNELGGNIIRNNLIARDVNDVKFMLLVRQFGGGSNLKFTKAQLESTMPGCANNIAATNPMLTSSTNERLQAGSPCIDVGYATAGVSYLDSAVDLGVYEYGGSD